MIHRSAIANFQRWLPFLRWMPDWQRPGTVRSDLLAGLAGAIVVLPQGVAFATLAGMPPAYGLYAAMIPCVVAAMFGSSRLMVTGPANAISLTTLALVSPLAAAGSGDYVRLVLTLTFLVGILQLTLGFVGVGSLIEKVPHAVVVGFTSGAAILIANSQLGPLLGLQLPPGPGVASNMWAILARLREIQPTAVLCASATIVAALLARPINRYVPAMLVAVVAGTLTATVLGLLLPSARPLATVAALPGAIPPMSWPDLSAQTLLSLWAPALVMTLLALTEAAAIAKAVARRRGDALDGNQEFIGQGLANVFGAFFSAYPASGSFNRSGVNIASGAQTPLAAVSAAVFLVLILSLVAPLAAYIPLAVIAGLLVIVAWGLLDWRELRRIWGKDSQERMPLGVTLAGTLLLSLEVAIVLGLLTALLVRRVKR